MDKITAQRFSRDLGVALTPERVFLFSNLSGNFENPFRVGISTDGLSFKNHSKYPIILDEEGVGENTKNCQDFRISSFGKEFVLFYKVYDQSHHIAVATSKDAIQWKKIGKANGLSEITMFIPDFQFENTYVGYTGEGDIRLVSSKDLRSFEVTEPLLTPRHEYFDNFPLEVGSVINTERGILLLYFVNQKKRDGDVYMIGAALFDKTNPGKLLWRSNEPIWIQPNEWNGKPVYPMGAVHFKEKFIVYFGIEGESVTAVAFSNFDEVFNLNAVTAKTPVLKKHIENPIISPVMHHAWESMSTFNPAAVYEDGKVHLMYRAQGDSSTSTIGYATSSDGVTIDERHHEPVYWPRTAFETPGGVKFHPNILFMSGGGWGGCEDPRLTKIDDRFYLTYVAYNGRDHPRVALSSIPVEDFLARNWDKWEKPKLISPPGVVDKNAVIFPEKVNGKYVMLHRIFPDILVDFLDDLEFEKQQYLKGEYKISPREHAWDSRKAGAGPPPIKTKDGWLLIYHAVDDKDASQYKIGAMLLDLEDPTKVLYRSNVPVLSPTEWYENEGFKSGVVYPCGAVIIENMLYIYYGGADSYVCVAARDVDEFLHELKQSSPVTVMPKASHHTVLTHI
jgi:predicted GH43/DUF377 family glycosyl hydrolase